MSENNEAKKSLEFTIEGLGANKDQSVKIVTVVPETGRGKGNPKLLPQDFSQWNLARVIALWGEDKVWKALVKPKVTQTFANFTSEATTRTKVVDGKTVEEPETDEKVIEKDYSEMFLVLSQRGETLQALSRRLNEIEGDELPRMLTEIMSDDVTPERIAELKPLAKALKEERDDLKKSIEEKKAKNKSSEDEEDETPAAANSEVTAA